MARLLALLLAASAGSAQGVLRTNAAASGFVRALEFKHQLRVCNAFPFSASLDVFLSKEKLSDQAMAYKTCKDFSAPLKSGDKLEFKLGDASAGSFSVADLPNNDAVLLLIIHRHDQLSTAVAFESHVFSNLANAQVAIIDTYKGSAKATPRIKDADTKAPNGQARSEELRYSSVVAVNQGKYDVELAGADGKVKANTALVALNHESYVILRTGVESKSGPAYPEELVVYPNSDPAALPHSGAPARRTPLAAFLVALVISCVVTFTAE